MVSLSNILPNWNSRPAMLGIVIRVDDSHRQAHADVLFAGEITAGVWEGHLEVIDSETS